MPKGYYVDPMIEPRADQRVLLDLVAKHMPGVWENLARYEVDLSLVSFHWFFTLFVDCMPLEVTLVVWDNLLLEGRFALFRFAMAVLKIHEAQLLATKSRGEMFTCLKAMRSQSYDMTELLHWANTLEVDMELVKLRYELHCDALHAEESQYAEDIAQARAKRQAAEMAKAAAARPAEGKQEAGAVSSSGAANGAGAIAVAGAHGAAAPPHDMRTGLLSHRGGRVPMESALSLDRASLAESAEAAAAAEARLLSRAPAASHLGSSPSSFTSTPDMSRPPHTPNMAMPVQANRASSRPRQISEDGRTGPVIPFSYGGPNALELIQRAMEGEDMLVEGQLASTVGRGEALRKVSSRLHIDTERSAGTRDVSLSQSSPFSPPSLPVGTVPLGSPISGQNLLRSGLGSPWLMERGEGITKSGNEVEATQERPKAVKRTAKVQKAQPIDSSFDSDIGDCPAHCIIPGSFDAEDEIA
jgi:hypothetical protein